MCLGIPMQVVEVRDGMAICEGMGERRDINMQLVGDQPAGTWVLTFLDTAREVLTEEDAASISDAVMAVNLVMQGNTDIDHLFADLIDREPPRPPSMPPDKS
jgi:hydrogenase expression/formation protein HypC